MKLICIKGTTALISLCALFKGLISIHLLMAHPEPTTYQIVAVVLGIAASVTLPWFIYISNTAEDQLRLGLWAFVFSLPFSEVRNLASWSLGSLLVVFTIVQLIALANQTFIAWKFNKLEKD